jgi:basic membrane protein A
LVTDFGGLNDGSLNAAANRGLTAAEKEFGVTTSVSESKSPADYAPSLAGYARQGYDLVIGVGVQMSGPVLDLARQFPNTKFALVDATPANAGSGYTSLANVANVLFQNNEAGYLVGIIAGEAARRRFGPVLRNTVCALVTVSEPPWSDITKGFEDGVRTASPTTKVILAALSDHFPRSSAEEETFAQRAHTIGLDHVAQGCDVLFAVASGMSRGYVLAAKEQRKYALAVFPTSSNINDQALASGVRPPGVVLAVALRLVDVAVKETIRSVTTGSFKSGDNVYGAAQDCIKYGLTDVALPDEIRAAVSDAYLGIKTGRIRPAGGIAPVGP